MKTSTSSSGFGPGPANASADRKNAFSRRRPAGKSSNRAFSAVVLAALGVGLGVSSSANAAQEGFYTVTPCRVADTRNAPGPYGGPALSANTERSFAVSGRCGVPSGAAAVALNVTVVQPTSSGGLRLFGGGAAPLASAINYAAGKVRANNGSYGLSSSGALVVRCDQASGSAHVILDVVGYFEGATAPVGSSWARRFGNSSDDRGQGVAVDDQNNVAVTGHFQGTTDFGGGSITSYAHPSMGPSRDMFIAAYGASGAYRWSRSVGGDSEEEGKAVATDAGGNVLVTGYQKSYSVNYGGGAHTSQGSSDFFVVKYSSTGGFAWSKTAGSTGFDSGTGIAADAAGNVFVTGGFDPGGVNFGGGALQSAGFQDVFLVKYSATGAHLWSRRFGGTSSDSGAAVATDAAGNVFMTGTFEGSVDFGGGALTSAGTKDVFVAKYNSSGAHLWSKRFGGSGYDYVSGIAVDEANDVAITGKFTNSISFGGSSLSSAGGDDAFLAKLSGSSGGHVWSKRFGSTGADNGGGVSMDASNNVAVTGYFSGTVDFGGGGLSASSIDVFVAKYTPSGAHTWSRKYGAASQQLGSGVAMARTGNVSVTGFFASTVDFGTGPLTSLGVNDASVASIGP